jgi:hypothetical protein
MVFIEPLFGYVWQPFQKVGHRQGRRRRVPNAITLSTRTTLLEINLIITHKTSCVLHLYNTSVYFIRSIDPLKGARASIRERGTILKTNSDRKRFYQNKREIRRNEISRGFIAASLNMDMFIPRSGISRLKPVYHSA